MNPTSSVQHREPLSDLQVKAIRARFSVFEKQVDRSQI
jgi:hypothetical protein